MTVYATVGELCAAAFAHLPVGGMIIERRGEKEFIVNALNEAAFKMGNWNTLRTEDVVGRNIAALFENLEQAGLLAQYGEVLDRGQPRSLGQVPYGDSEVPDAVFQIDLIPLDASHLLIAYTNVSEEVHHRIAMEEHAEELARANEDLQRFNRLTVGREMRIVELKELVNDLCAELGREQPYKG